MADFLSTLGQVGQQFKGPLSELAHETTKLIIKRLSEEDSASGFGLQTPSGLGDSAIGATGLGGAINNFKATLGDDTFALQINPAQYNTTYQIEYHTPKAQGEQVPTTQFSRMVAQVLELGFTIDGTGVVPASVTDLSNYGKQMLAKTIGGNDISYVTKSIERLYKVAGEYNNSEHKPPKIQVTWGDVPPFVGRLEQLDVNYTLFHPSGIPLRAEVKLKLTEDRKAPLDPTPTESPDVTHRRTVHQHDTLLLLTRDVYKDSRYYWQVARFNNLTHYRRLKQQSDLYFPPLDRSTTPSKPG